MRKPIRHDTFVVSIYAALRGATDDQERHALSRKLYRRRRFLWRKWLSSQCKWWELRDTLGHVARGKSGPVAGVYGADGNELHGDVLRDAGREYLSGLWDEAGNASAGSDYITRCVGIRTLCDAVDGGAKRRRTLSGRSLCDASRDLVSDCDVMAGWASSTGSEIRELRGLFSSGSWKVDARGEAIPADIVAHCGAEYHPLDSDDGFDFGTGSYSGGSEYAPWSGFIGQRVWNATWSRMKRGRAVGSDGLSSEALLVMGRKGRHKLQHILECMFLGDPIPQAWRTWFGFFLRNSHKSRLLSEHRFICLCPATYKLASRVVCECLTSFMENKWRCQQYARRGRQGTEMAHCIKLTQLPLRGWQAEGFCAKVDLHTAFDMMRRPLVVLAPQLYGVPIWIHNFIIRVLNEVAIRAAVGSETLDSVELGRGLGQGTLESPLLCQILIDFIVGYLIPCWVREGAVITLDRHRLDDVVVDVISHMIVMDDMNLFAHSFERFAIMLGQLYSAFRLADLDIRSERAKSCWTSLGASSSSDGLIQIGTVGSDFSHLIEPAPQKGMKVLGAIVDWEGGGHRELAHRIGGMWNT